MFTMQIFFGYGIRNRLAASRIRVPELGYIALRKSDTGFTKTRIRGICGSGYGRHAAASDPF